MKYFFLKSSIIFVMFFFSCSEKEGVQPIEDDVVLLSDWDEFSKALIIPGKKILQGSLPNGTSSFLMNSVTSQNTANGTTTALMFRVDQSVSGMYLKVKGAGIYLEVPIEQRVDGMALIPITIPSNVIIDSQSFTIKYQIFKEDGTISNIKEMNYSVSQIPVGEVLITLAWNTSSNLCMTIERPEGTVILGKGVDPTIYGGFYTYEPYDGSSSITRYTPQAIYWDDSIVDGKYYLNLHMDYGFLNDTDYFITINANDRSKLFQGVVNQVPTKEFITTFTVDGNNVQF